MADKVTIHNGTITADTVNVDVQLNANAVSVSGDVTIAGDLSIAGKDVFTDIAEQKALLENHASLIGQSDSPHLSTTEHTQLTHVIQLFDTYDAATTVPKADAPQEAISLEYFPILFKNRAMANWDIATAPGHVFVSRVPYAVEIEHTDGSGNKTYTYEYTYSTMESSGSAYEDYGVLPSKLMDNRLPDNTPRRHKCSTDTVEEVDDYVGKEWAFFWEYGNYIKDEKGIKHITSIRGAKPTASIQGSSYNAPDFDIKKNTAAFGPVFWFFCKPEKWQDPVSGEWMSYDKTETGAPITQLWGISDSPWDTIDEDHPMFNGVVYPGLSDAKKEALMAIGVTADDFHLWPECKVWDADEAKWLIRPYWCHSAFNGGYMASEPGLCSICNAPLNNNNLQYNILNAFSNYTASGAPGGACITGFSMLFDIIKNATKDSQSIHKGMSNGNASMTVANYAITEEENSLLKDTYGGYVFPVANTGQFAIGRTVRLVNNTSGNSVNISYDHSYSIQIGRIKAIRTDLSFTAADGTAVTGAAGIIIDPAENTIYPIYPFSVCTTIADANAIIAQNKYACCGACCGMAAAGETLNGGTAGTGVIGYHDGSIVSNTNGKYLYRVQGTEYMPGAYNCAGDTVAVKGNGTEIPYNGSTINPDSTKYIIFTCPQGTNRISGNSSPSTWITAGYEAVGLTPNKTGNVLNEQLSPQGVAHPVLIGGSGGHVDNVQYVSQNPANFMTLGELSVGSGAGSAYLALYAPGGDTSWRVAARD